jgi:hypothetical protein
MSGDGISLQTALAQLGNLARSQAKSQQSPQATVPAAEQLAQQEALKTQRVKRADAVAKRRIDPDAEDDRRRRRRLKRKARKREREDGATPDAADDEPGQAAVGGLIDTRV